MRPSWTDPRRSITYGSDERNGSNGSDDSNDDSDGDNDNDDYGDDSDDSGDGDGDDDGSKDDNDDGDSNGDDSNDNNERNDRGVADAGGEESFSATLFHADRPQSFSASCFIAASILSQFCWTLRCRSFLISGPISGTAYS